MLFFVVNQMSTRRVRFDDQVKVSGMAESLSLGILSSFVFGLGLCLFMHIIGEGALPAFFGIALVIIGTAGMFFAYPVFRRVFLKTKKEFTPRILRLTDELTGGKIEF